MSRDHSNASLQAMLPLVAKATVVAAGAAYVLYKFLWTDDEPEVADDNSDEPHWSEIESQRSKNRPLHPKPEFPTDESSKTTTTANDDPTYDEDGFEVQPMFPQTPQKTSRKSLSSTSLSFENKCLLSKHGHTLNCFLLFLSLSFYLSLPLSPLTIREIY